MNKQEGNNIRLGIFVLAGLFFLILLLYVIGRNRNLFGSSYVLKARFENVQGLKSGNNVRYAGIDVGTVKRVTILNDTLMEVNMVIDDRMKTIIHRNAIVSIGTDGLVGNKVVNINASGQVAELAVDGDVLVSKKPINTDEMLQTLYKTNNDISIIAAQLKSTIRQVNSSAALWTLLNDSSLPVAVKQTATNLKSVTAKANTIMDDVGLMMAAVNKQEGSLGKLVHDTVLYTNLNEAVLLVKDAGEQIGQLAAEVTSTVSAIDQAINNGKGTANALLKDSAMTLQLNESLENIRKGTEAFNQNMEALKQSILFRGYFRRQEKRKQVKSNKQLVTGN